jgi:hypothetical protein
MVQLELASFFALTGNGLILSEDLARRFICVELDARCEDPEQRLFPPGFLGGIKKCRSELLAAGLTILRWGGQNSGSIERGRALGSFEDWGVWVRDPLVALGCRDPVDRISALKARDPERQRVIALFAAWHDAHGDNPVKITDLVETVRNIADPNNRGRQYLARVIGGLSGTRLGGFVLERQDPTNNRKQGAQYRLLVLRNDQNPSASPAVSAHPGLGASRDADAADGADAFRAKPKALACAHCSKGGEIGEVLTCSIGGETRQLHRDCIELWTAAHPRPSDG